MEKTQGNCLQSLLNVQAFLADHAERLPDVVRAGTRRKLDALVAEVGRMAVEQERSRIVERGLTKRIHVLRRELLRDHMTPIARIASAELIETPAVEPLRLPRVRITSQRLAAAARGMAEAATRHAGVFVNAGLSPDFVRELEAAAEALLGALNDRAQRRGGRRGATDGLRAGLSAGRRLVHVLDALVQRALREDETLLAHWNNVKRVERIPGRRHGVVSAAPIVPSSSARRTPDVIVAAVRTLALVAGLGGASRPVRERIPECSGEATRSSPSPLRRA